MELLRRVTGKRNCEQLLNSPGDVEQRLCNVTDLSGIATQYFILNGMRFLA